ncbi:MAG: calcium-translocating P-type ATPase, SERCA-type [Bacillota bacterium]|nr:calcium-translocating P-type ATPase, SERCA-type [Bacillota bacterium]
MKKSRLWAISPLKEVYNHFRVDPGYGISETEALQRLKKWGTNTIEEKKRKSVFEIFLDQFRDFMVLVLLGATLVSGLLHEYSDAITIIVIVVLNAVLGFIQEYKAERSFEALKSLSAPRGKVLREGGLKEIPAEDVVPGDVIDVRAGDRVCADIRLIHTDALMADESPLTGESVAVEKEDATLNFVPSSPGDTKNMVFSGTLIINGTGRGIAVATGMETEMGNIVSLIQEVEVSSTPLQKRLAKLGKVLVLACFVLCLFVVVMGLWRGEELYKMLMAGISLAVAAIPEGLPAIVTISLALGVQRMVKRKAIVRRLPAVETLGCATVICSDKTGTITQNKMTVKSIYTNGEFWNVEGEGYELSGMFYQGHKKVDASGEEHLSKTLLIGVLCNNALLVKNDRRITPKSFDKSGKAEGNPTEAALLVCAAKANIWKEQLEERFPRIKEFPFSSGRKCMSVLCREGEKINLFVKGAPERILNMSSYIFEDGKVRPLREEHRKKILKQVDILAGGALRTLAVAYRTVPSSALSSGADELEKELVFTGFFGMIDPPRPAVLKAIKSCDRAGIRITMITGDHRNTAVAIARQIGILKSGGEVITGDELDRLNEKELFGRIEKLYVFARVSPEHKLRIVRCLKARGHIVAMTGDGVNDAPAVKEADIGIAMGSTGTEVTKEAASLVLADDNFKTIVAAVEEGRGIYDNIRKFIRFLLGCNLGEILTMFLAMLWGLPLPLRPIQILWVNLVTDGLPAMALGVDPTEKDVMQRPPRSPSEGVFGRGLWKKILTKGFIIGVTSVLVFAFALITSSELIYAQTMALSTLIVTQLLHVFECRSEYLKVWEVGFTRNLMLVGAVVVSFFLLLCIVYNPFLQSVFQTYPLKGSDWIIIFGASSITYVLSFLSWCIGKAIYRETGQIISK